MGWFLSGKGSVPDRLWSNSPSSIHPGEFRMSSSYGTASSFHLPAAVWVIYLAVLILCIVAAWRIFTKAGKPGWRAIIPIVNTVVL